MAIRAQTVVSILASTEPLLYDIMIQYLDFEPFNLYKNYFLLNHCN
jgi:hypothetical protein